MKKQLEDKVQNIYCAQDGRLIIIDIAENDQIVTIAAIYAPNIDTPAFFTEVGNRLRERQENKVIIGDFNLVMEVEKDRKNTYHNNNNARDEVENLIDEFSLRDVWRVQNEDVFEYSWFKRGCIQKASRIDFALVSGGLDQKTKMAQYLPGIMTDHRALYICIELTTNERGVGYWKLNNRLLQNKDYVGMMNLEIERTLHASVNKQPNEIWEILKVRIKKRSQEFSRKNVAQENIVIGNLAEKVNELESEFPLDREQSELLESTKIDLEEKILEKTRGIIFRSKVRWYELGERNTKYFFSLEKARYNSKTCFKIIEDEQEYTVPKEILEVQKRYYQLLYEKDEEVEFNMENDFNVRVPGEIAQQQNVQINMQELGIATRSMNNDRTPGEDGIPVDFYKVFWGKLKEPFYNMVLDCFQKQQLHPSARRGILNLIPKAGKDTRLIKNLRPITLLNTDYKIIEKAVANKMLPALQHIINKDQRGFMKDRRISVNIRKMLDIIHYAEKQDLEAVVLSLDFVKCFDKCSFSILFGSLDFFGFGSIVKEWTKVLYRDFSVKIQNNGYFSKGINIKKGVHQGGCCSAIYFLVIAEILALSLRANTDIEGITIRNIRHLLNQFADDMDTFSMCNETSIRGMFNQLEAFRLQSGFTISYEKTSLYRIGSLRHSNARMYNIEEVKWTNEDISVLGIKIAHENIVEKNYQDIIAKVKSTLYAWYNRGLSLMGKIQVVNTLVASLFVYRMMVLPKIPVNIIKVVENHIREFIWGGKKAKIALGILQNTKKEGGLNLVNLRNKDIALKATWPQIIHSEPEYASMVYDTIRCNLLQEDIWRCRLLKEDINGLKIQNEFWKDVLIAWSEYNFFHDFRIENQIIWYNSQIRINGRPVMWNDIYKKGLKYVYQLFEGGHFRGENEVYREFGLTKLRYNSIKVAIPKEWKKFFCETPRSVYLPIPPQNYDIVISTGGKGLSQKIYRYISQDISQLQNKFLGWYRELGEDIGQDIIEFGRMHLDLYRVTNIPKYRSFQYRILQRALVTNVQLYHWKKVETQECTFCNDDKETISHMLVKCRVVQRLWDNFCIYIKEQYGEINPQMSVKNILLNKIVPRKYEVINFLCLVTKQFIYRQRCMAQELHFPILKGILRSIEIKDKYIAQKNGKIVQHYRKWDLRAQEAIVDRRDLSAFVNEYISDM